MSLRRVLSVATSTPVLLACSVFLLMRMWDQSGQPVASQVFNREIDFIDHRVKYDVAPVTVETNLAVYTFSPVGAVLSGVVCKKLSGDAGDLHILHERGEFEREQGAFLLALERESPLNYHFDGQKEDAQTITVSFSTKSVSGWEIFKVYTLHKDTFQFDLTLRFSMLKSSANVLRPRLFVNGPFLGEDTGNSMSGHVLVGEGRGFSSVSSRDENDKAWDNPAIVAIDDRYFVSALVGAEPGFVKRAYYRRLSGPAGLSFIVEGAAIDTTSEVKTSFYLGPKMVAHVERVNERLVGLWISGIFSGFKRLILWLFSLLLELLGNYGFAIIALMAMLRIPFMPISIYFRRKVLVYEDFRARYASVLDAIPRKHAGNAALQQEEMMRFHREHGHSPFDPLLYSLVPNLLLIPIFISFYSLLKNSVVFYKAPFALWITDVSAADPYYILPALLAVGSLLSGQRGGQKHSMFTYVVMPIIVFAFTSSLATGVLLYLLVNVLILSLENYLARYL